MSTTMGVVRAQRAAWEDPKRRAKAAEVMKVEDIGSRKAESPPVTLVWILIFSLLTEGCDILLVLILIFCFAYRGLCRLQ